MGVAISSKWLKWNGGGPSQPSNQRVDSIRLLSGRARQVGNMFLRRRRRRRRDKRSPSSTRRATCEGSKSLPARESATRRLSHSLPASSSAKGLKWKPAPRWRFLSLSSLPLLFSINEEEQKVLPLRCIPQLPPLPSLVSRAANFAVPLPLPFAFCCISCEASALVIFSRCTLLSGRGTKLGTNSLFPSPGSLPDGAPFV